MPRSNCSLRCGRPSPTPRPGLRPWTGSPRHRYALAARRIPRRRASQRIHGTVSPSDGGRWCGVDAGSSTGGATGPPTQYDGPRSSTRVASATRRSWRRCVSTLHAAGVISGEDRCDAGGASPGARSRGFSRGCSMRRASRRMARRCPSPAGRTRETPQDPLGRVVCHDLGFHVRSVHRRRRRPHAACAAGARPRDPGCACSWRAETPAHRSLSARSPFSRARASDDRRRAARPSNATFISLWEGPTPVRFPGRSFGRSSVRALTVWQPYAGLLATGRKPGENRTREPPAWALKPGDRLAIHAGRVYDRESWEAAFRVHRAIRLRGLSEPPSRPAPWPLVGIRPSTDADREGITPYGGVIGVATFVEARRTPRGEDPWFAGPVCWYLDDAVPIDPVWCYGAEGLWQLSPEVERAVIDRVDAVRAVERSMSARWTGLPTPPISWDARSRLVRLPGGGWTFWRSGGKSSHDPHETT